MNNKERNLGIFIVCMLISIVAVAVCAIDTVETAGFGTFLVGTIIIGSISGVVSFGAIMGCEFLARHNRSFRNFWIVICGGTPA